MTDSFLDLAHTPFGKQVFASLNIPSPPLLKRAREGYADQPFAGVGAVVGSVANPLYKGVIEQALSNGGALLGSAMAPLIVFDASGAAAPSDLKAMYSFMQDAVKGMPSNARVVVVGRAPADCTTAGEAASAGALSGFVKSLSKEIGRKGAIANLVQVANGAEAWIAGALAFFLSGHAAYVTGQVLPLVGAPEGLAPAALGRSLAGKTAVVTGAARGIGAAIAAVLAREGARVIGIDRPQELEALEATLKPISGRALPLDVTAADAGEQIVKTAGKVDIMVHNAGVTRDKMLRNMPEQMWDMVLAINLEAILRINDRLLDGAFAPGARVVCISSIGGIAGNAGQTNYAATKSGVFTLAATQAPIFAKMGYAINAVAPGFIETQMTAAIPPINRFVGRRISSLSQGGLPVDIAEAVTFFSSGALSGGANGATLRVCGQNWLGA